MSIGTRIPNQQRCIALSHLSQNTNANAVEKTDAVQSAVDQSDARRMTPSQFSSDEDLGESGIPPSNTSSRNSMTTNSTAPRPPSLRPLAMHTSPQHAVAKHQIEKYVSGGGKQCKAYRSAMTKLVQNHTRIATKATQQLFKSASADEQRVHTELGKMQSDHCGNHSDLIFCQLTNGLDDAYKKSSRTCERHDHSNFKEMLQTLMGHFCKEQSLRDSGDVDDSMFTKMCGGSRTPRCKLLKELAATWKLAGSTLPQSNFQNFQAEISELVPQFCFPNNTPDVKACSGFQMFWMSQMNKMCGKSKNRQTKVRVVNSRNSQCQSLRTLWRSTNVLTKTAEVRQSTTTNSNLHEEAANKLRALENQRIKAMKLHQDALHKISFLASSKDLTSSPLGKARMELARNDVMNSAQTVGNIVAQQSAIMRQVAKYIQSNPPDLLGELQSLTLL